MKAYVSGIIIVSPSCFESSLLPSATPSPPPPAARVELSALESAIIARLGAEPTPVKTLQRRLGYASYSYMASGVRGLIGKGLAVRVNNGIRLTQRGAQSSWQ